VDPHCSVGPRFIISSIYGYKLFFGSGSVKIWKTRHKISVDIRIRFTVYVLPTGDQTCGGAFSITVYRRVLGTNFRRIFYASLVQCRRIFMNIHIMGLRKSNVCSTAGCCDKWKVIRCFVKCAKPCRIDGCRLLRQCCSYRAASTARRVRCRRRTCVPVYVGYTGKMCKNG